MGSSRPTGRLIYNGANQLQIIAGTGSCFLHERIDLSDHTSDQGAKLDERLRKLTDAAVTCDVWVSMYCGLSTREAFNSTVMCLIILSDLIER